MKFVRQLPDKQFRTGSRFDTLVGVDNIEIIRRNPSKWALVAEQQPKSGCTGFLTWAKKRGLEAATRTNPHKPTTVDFYLRFQPKRGEDW